MSIHHKLPQKFHDDSIPFDTARDFYGHPDGPYNCFAGADASYMLGAMNLERENRNKCDFEQDGDHQMTLSDWISKYCAKYPIVGRLDGFEDLCPESWREAGYNNDVIDAQLKIDDIYGCDFKVIKASELAECAKYDNKDKWMSVCGIVFNVQSAEVVYESMYGDFADCIGKDVSVALALNKFDEDTFNESVESLKDEKQSLGKLKKMLKLFIESYPIIGYLDDDDKYRLDKLGDISEEWDIVEPVPEEKSEETEPDAN